MQYASPVRRYRLDFSFTSALMVIVAVVAAVVLSRVTSAASRPLGWALAAGIVALLLTPIVGYFSRHLPHWAAIVVTLLIVVVGLGGTWVTLSATLADNVDTIKAEAPSAAAELEQQSSFAKDFMLEDRVTSFVNDLDERLGTGAEVRRAANTAPTYVVTGMLMLFLLIYGPRFVDGGLAQISDDRRRARARSVVESTIASGRTYLLLTLAKGLAVTVVVWVTGVVVDVQASMFLGVIAGLSSAIPYFGIVLGGMPALLIAAAFGSTVDFVVVLAVLVTLQIVDAVVVMPRIEARSIHVGPALPLIVGLLGWAVYGFGGAVYGVAAMVMLLALAHAVSTEDDGADVVAPSLGHTDRPRLNPAS